MAALNFTIYSNNSIYYPHRTPLLRRVTSNSKINFRIGFPQPSPGNFFTTNIPAPLARKEENKPLVGSLVGSGADFINSFSSHIRKDFELSNLIFETENPEGLAPLGFTVGFNLVFGGVNVKNGIKEVATAQKVSDTVGQRLAELKIARGGTQFAGAAFLIPSKILTILDLARSSKAYAVAAGTLGRIGGAFFNVFLFIVMGSLGLSLFEQYQFRKEFHKILKDPNLTEDQRYSSALAYLKKRAMVSPEEKEKIRQEVRANKKYQQLNQELLNQKIAGRESKLLQKKEMGLKRLFGEDGLEKIRQSTPSQAKAVVDEIQCKGREKVILNSSVMGLLSLSVIVMVASFFTKMLAAVPIIGLVTNIGWLIIDGYALFKNFNSDPGRYDKALLFFSTVVAVIVVTCVFFLTGGIAPTVAALGVGLVWLGINAFCHYRLSQLENQQSSPNRKSALQIPLNSLC
jgi:hypothetical protein